MSTPSTTYSPIGATGPLAPPAQVTDAAGLGAALPPWLVGVVDRLSEGLLIVEVEGDDARIVFANQCARDWSDSSGEELVGRSLWSLLSPAADRVEIVRLRAALREGATYRGVVKQRARDGSAVVLEFEAAPLAMPDNGNIVRYVVHQRDSAASRRGAEDLRQANEDLERRVADRTTALADLARRMTSEVAERVRSEAALRLSEQRFRTLCDHAPVGVFMADPTGACRYTNPRLQAINNATADELLGDGYVRRIHPDDREAVIRQWRADIDQRRESITSFRVVQAPGRYRWVLARAAAVYDDNGELWGYVGSVKDVTDQRTAEESLREAHVMLEERVEQRSSELRRANQWLAAEVRERRQVEQALRESEARWRALVEHAPAFILLIDSAGVIQFINRAREGVRIEELVGGNIYDMVHPDSLELFRERLEHCRATGEPTEFEAQGKEENGDVIWYQTRVAPVRHGAQTDWLLVSTDITDRRRAEERVRQQQAELAHVARIHTATELATGLAHEINQPLTAIASSADAMLRFLRRSEPLAADHAVEVIEHIADQARRAAAVVRHLRGFVRKAPSSRQPADINALVKDTIAFMRHEASRAEVRIETDLEAGLPLATVDSVQIQQVLVNLIKNACESMRDTPAADRLVRVRTRRPDDSCVEIAVVDCGTGVDENIADQIFDSFFTTRPTGLGLGLCISRSLVEDHGGKLWMTTNARRGVTFHCRLPTTGPTHDGA